jgi:hypothetical protein
MLKYLSASVNFYLCTVLMSQVGDFTELVGTFLPKLYLNEVVGRGPGPLRLDGATLLRKGTQAV